MYFLYVYVSLLEREIESIWGWIGSAIVWIKGEENGFVIIAALCTIVAAVIGLIEWWRWRCKKMKLAKPLEQYDKISEKIRTILNRHYSEDKKYERLNVAANKIYGDGGLIDTLVKSYRNIRSHRIYVSKYLNELLILKNGFREKIDAKEEIINGYLRSTKEYNNDDSPELAELGKRLDIEYDGYKKLVEELLTEMEYKVWEIYKEIIISKER